MNYAYSGLEPWSYHLFNTFVHFLASVALFAFTFLVSKQQSGHQQSTSKSFGIAMAVSLIWAAHPLNTQAVTYVIQRAESLAGLMLFLFLLLYGHAALAMRPTRESKVTVRGKAGKWKAWSLFGLAFTAFLTGSLCKETMVMALPIAMVYDRAMLSNSWMESFRARGWFWLLCAAPIIAAVPIVWPSLFSTDSTVGFNMKSISWWEYVRTQPEVLLHYLQLAVVPFPQCFDYGWPASNRTSSIVFSGALVVSTMIALVACFRTFPWWCFWGIAIALYLAPTTLIPLQDLAVEHRMYVPLAFLLIAVVTWVSLQAERRGAILGRLIGFVSVIVVVILFSSLTIARNAMYSSATLMWQDVISYVHHSGRESMWLGRAYANLGEALAADRQWEESIEASEKAISEHAFSAEVHGNLVRAYIATNRLDQAQHHLDIALAAKPNSARLVQQAGLIAAAKQNFPAAINHFENAESLAPQDVIIKNNLARALAQAGQTSRAIEVYRDAIRVDVQHAPSHSHLVELLIDKKDLEDASRQVTAYRERFPTDVQAIWLSGLVAFLSGDPKAALEVWDIIKQKPPPRFHFFRGNAHLQLGQINEAISAYQAELIQDPRSVESLLNLGGVFAASDPARAETYYIQVIHLAPNYLDARYNLAIVQIKLNKQDVATSSLQNLLKIDPKYGAAIKLLDLLNKDAEAVIPQ